MCVIIHQKINHPWPPAIGASRVLTMTDANCMMRSHKNLNLEATRCCKLGKGFWLLRKLVRTRMEEKSSDRVQASLWMITTFNLE